MMVAMLIAGIGLVLAGLLAIGVGVPNKEFSVGGTLIVTGVVGVCTGAMMLALWVAVRELKTIARRLGAGAVEPRGEVTVRPVLPPGVAREQPSGDGEFLFPRDQPQAASAELGAPSTPSSPARWHDEVRSPDAAPPPVEAAPAVKPRRNLLFSTSSRKERERAQARTSEPLPPDLLPPDLRPNPSAEPVEAQPPSFEDAWPRTDRARPGGDIPPQRRTPRTPSTFNETNGAAGQDRALAPRYEGRPQVTVLKSGVVDGMAYSLYSDGSIEAQMPEGMMRFASIDELRSHLDHRP